MKASDMLLVKRGLLFERSAWTRIKERAKVEGVTLSTLVRELLRDGLEAREAGRGAVPKTRADHLAELMEESLKEVRILVILLGAVGRCVIANQQLLVHWASRDEGLGVNEDDLFAELQAAGAEGWAQVLDDLQPERVQLEDPDEKRRESDG
jgi:hypothetical protein